MDYRASAIEAREKQAVAVRMSVSETVAPHLQPEMPSVSVFDFMVVTILLEAACHSEEVLLPVSVEQSTTIDLLSIIKMAAFTTSNLPLTVLTRMQKGDS